MNLEPAVERDLKTLANFVELYCRYQHAEAEKAVVTAKTHDVSGIVGREISLCADCRKLMLHAWVKRSNCPMDPKPQCKHCPNHCYQANYREKIQEVMRFSGKKMIMGGRLDYLVHLLF